MKEAKITFKGNITQRDKMCWSKALNAVVDSLTDCERRILPEFKIYPNIMMSIVDNYDLEDLETDDVATYLFDSAAWGYCRTAVDPIKGRVDQKDRFISLSIEWGREMIEEEYAPEMIVFHEIGHFKQDYRTKKSTFFHEDHKAELTADRYALYALARMLYHNPEYQTISRFKEHIKFMDNIREEIREEVGDEKLSAAALRGRLMRVANRMLIRLDLKEPDAIESDKELTNTPTEER